MGSNEIMKTTGEGFDVVVYGATPGGIAAAVGAARLGRTVALVEYHRHLGGMAASGLGKSDVETRAAIGGLFREFVQRVHDHYVKTYGPEHANVKLCQAGYYYEPSVAERALGELVTEQSGICVFVHHRLEEAVRAGNRLIGVRVTDRATGERRDLRAQVFIDATYEGDLAAYAGADYRLGREARSEFNELHAGVVYMDYETRKFLAGTTGEGDRRLQAYTFRLCLTGDPLNSFVLREPPPGYDRSHYLGYLDDWRAGRLGPPKEMHHGMGYYAPTFNTMVRALSLAELPNGKFDANMNPRPLGFPFAEENYDYPEADWETREAIARRIRNLTLGLLYFLQNDPEIPEEQRRLARRFNLAKDEFTDNEHFPWQLYIREARRIVGEYTLSENDLILGTDLARTRIHRDSIAAGEFPVDSFPVRKRQPGHDTALEGYVLMLNKMTYPYQIPYRVLVPRKVEGLLVPVAASATHVAFSTIRLEPTWMALGQAAGTAAHLALRDQVSVRQVSVDALQHELLRQGQVITFFRDIDATDPCCAALQYFGTRGLFTDYDCRAHEPLERSVARQWIHLALGRAGVTAAETLPEAGELTRNDLDALLTKCGFQVSSAADPAGSAVTRGDFCQTLYGAMFPGESEDCERGNRSRLGGSVGVVQQAH